mmetsp:Transcript_21394/g.37869  ORF Transcript_21394/g.37869 Transcript_21394/m.37869 type:complete len:212 (-) Transcript_21394:791-1426(-)
MWVTPHSNKSSLLRATRSPLTRRKGYISVASCAQRFASMLAFALTLSIVPVSSIVQETSLFVAANVFDLASLACSKSPGLNTGRSPNTGWVEGRSPSLPPVSPAPISLLVCAAFKAAANGCTDGLLLEEEEDSFDAGLSTIAVLIAIARGCRGFFALLSSSSSFSELEARATLVLLFLLDALDLCFVLLLDSMLFLLLSRSLSLSSESVSL